VDFHSAHDCHASYRSTYLKFGLHVTVRSFPIGPALFSVIVGSVRMECMLFFIMFHTWNIGLRCHFRSYFIVIALYNCIITALWDCEQAPRVLLMLMYCIHALYYCVYFVCHACAIVMGYFNTSRPMVPFNKLRINSLDCRTKRTRMIRVGPILFWKFYFRVFNLA